MLSITFAINHRREHVNNKKPYSPLEADEMVEKLNYKISQLTPGARALAEKLLDALLEEDVKKVAPLGKTAKNTR